VCIQQEYKKETSLAGIQVLILKNDVVDPAGLLGTILEEHGITYREVDVEREALPAIDYEALVVMGGPQYANENLAYLVAEKALMRNALERSIPLFSVCLGGQLLASVCGAEVKRHGDTEIGFYEVQLTEEGRQDPLFKGLEGTSHSVFQWHNDTFDLPAGAVLLEAGDTTRYQAFRYGPHAYGLQYHPELTEGLLRLWLGLIQEEDAADLQKYNLHNRISEDEIGRSYPIYQEHTRVIFSNFLKICGLLPKERA
jgi:GMP synthase (glutamine-hydrolysing)